MPAICHCQFWRTTAVGSEFCRSDRDLAADEQAAATAAPAPLWLKILPTPNLPKSFKMVLLRVLFDHGAVFSGMPIPELAAKCREFLVAHEFLRRDIADAATGQPVEMSPRKWESSWRKFPIWMLEQEGRS